MFVTENLGLRAMGRDQQHTRSSTECRPTSWTNERGEVGAAVQYYGVAKFARLLQYNSHGPNGTMTPSVSYHCPCLSTDPVPPPPNTPSSSYLFHPLHELFFCEECDAVRCNRCVSVEVSGYYCPNCLFEVPSASVRAEKNRSVSGIAIVRRVSPFDVLLTDAHAIASCALIAETRFPWYLQTPRTQMTEDP